MSNQEHFKTMDSQAYDISTRTSIPNYDALFKMIESYFRSQITSDEASVLIVGAGGGNEITSWGPSNLNWSFTGVDPSAAMLQIANDKTHQLGIENRVKLVQGTVQELPQNLFDAASCILVFHFIHDRDEKLDILRSIKDKLKPNAPFAIVSAYGELHSQELKNRINIWKSFFLSAGQDSARLETMEKNVSEQLSMLTEAELVELLEEAGFKNVTRFYSTGIFGGWMCHA